jgi:hypothetical protein
VKVHEWISPAERQLPNDFVLFFTKRFGKKPSSKIEGGDAVISWSCSRKAGAGRQGKKAAAKGVPGAKRDNAGGASC